jgi:tripartite-type tricarboxylate transporter receptor subunit TctC
MCEPAASADERAQQGLAAPAGTPDPVLDGLSGAVARAQQAAFWRETVRRGKISIE